MIQKQILSCQDSLGNLILQKAQLLNTKIEKLLFNNLPQCKSMTILKSTEVEMDMDLRGPIFA